MARRQAAKTDRESTIGPSISTGGLKNLPAELEAPQSKLVYLALWTCGGSTVDDLKTMLDLSKLTLLGVLTSLIDDGFVDRDGPRYVVDR